jgi:hypothetical protein
LTSDGIAEGGVFCGRVVGVGTIHLQVLIEGIMCVGDIDAEVGEDERLVGEERSGGDADDGVGVRAGAMLAGAEGHGCGGCGDGVAGGDVDERAGEQFDEAAIAAAMSAAAGVEGEGGVSEEVEDRVVAGVCGEMEGLTTLWVFDLERSGFVHGWNAAKGSHFKLDDLGAGPVR